MLKIASNSRQINSQTRFFGLQIFGKYEVVTPLMLGGANHAPEFRLASYVHMLRWWWRFLALSRFGTVESASFWEAVMFGWHTKDFGRKRVSFRLMELDERGYPAPWGNGLELNNWSGISYLTAQGFKDRTSAKVKSFKVEARIGQRKLNDVPDFAGEPAARWCLAQKTLIDAIALIGLLGGLGSRSRRGFGSLAVSELKIEDGPAVLTDNEIHRLPESVEDYKGMIARHLGTERHSGLPPYSALSKAFTHKICASHNNARELMNDIGWAFQIYRSWGQRKDYNNPGNGHKHVKKTDGAENTLDAGDAKAGWYKTEFKDDHNNFYDRGNNGYGTFPNNKFDNRAVFGLPHNYGKKEVGWDTRSGTGTHHRRASPLLFHFHRLGDGTTAFLASVIPADFAPNGACLRVDGNLRTGRGLDLVSNIDFCLAEGFAAFLCNPDATGAGEGVQYTSFTAIP